MQRPRAALIYDWLMAHGGGERVLETFAELVGASEVFTLLYDERRFADSPIRQMVVRTSGLQRWPVPKRYFRHLLPFMPIYVEQINTNDCDLVVSVSHALSHGVITRPDQLHVAFINNTMRYAWDSYHQDRANFRVASGIAGLCSAVVYHYLRMWDYCAFQRPDLIVANSAFCATRLLKYYGRKATVIHPGADLKAFWPEREKADYYVVVGRMVPIKRIRRVVEAFNHSRRPLVVIGDGPLRSELQESAQPNITFVGWRPTAEVSSYLRNARALVFPSEENFGIVSVEAQACGTPVLSVRGGGVVETIVEGVTGMFFDQATPAGINDTVERFELRRGEFSAERLRVNAERFSLEVFKDKVARLLDATYSARKDDCMGDLGTPRHREDLV